MESNTVSSFGIKFHFLVSVLFLLCQYNLGASAEYFCPTTNISSYVKFQLYSRDIPNRFELFIHNHSNFVSSGFKLDKPTKLVTHGFNIWVDNDTPTSLIIAGFKNFTDSNIILIDWSAFSGRKTTEYPFVVSCVRSSLAPFLGSFISYLVKEGVPQESFHLIGHSLGGQLVGLASKYLDFKLPRITGLDPAGPLFDLLSTNGEKLDKTDAQVVDVIHSNSLVFGSEGPDGTFDFYVNGGSHQPGCAEHARAKQSFVLNSWFSITSAISHYLEEGLGSAVSATSCSHARAYQLFAASIDPAHKFPSAQCSSVIEARNEICRGKKGFAGYYLENTEPGVYATSTKGYQFSNIHY